MTSTLATLGTTIAAVKMALSGLYKILPEGYYSNIKTF